MYPENLYAERALRAGAQGYLNKSQPTRYVLDAIRTLLQGKVYISNVTAERVLQRMVGRNSEESSAIDSLSDRELEAFQHIGEGMTTDSIAAKMHVSPKTVETFRARIKEKLGIGSFTELIQRATQWVVESKYQTVHKDQTDT
jgi:DNA-binding NarL/FixJ family response regulator